MRTPRVPLALAAFTQSVDFESELASDHKEHTAANEMYGKLRAEFQSSRDQNYYNQQRAIARYIRVDDGWLYPESDHCREVLSWEISVKDLGYE